MKIKINGEDFYTKEETITIIELLKEQKVTRPETVSVQFNERMVKRNKLNTTVVKENDELNFLFMMSGGSF